MLARRCRWGERFSVPCHPTLAGSRWNADATRARVHPRAAMSYPRLTAASDASSSISPSAHTQLLRARESFPFDSERVTLPTVPFFSDTRLNQRGGETGAMAFWRRRQEDVGQKRITCASTLYFALFDLAYRFKAWSIFSTVTPSGECFPDSSRECVFAEDPPIRRIELRESSVTAAP